MAAPSTFHEEEVLGRAYDGRLMRRLLVYARPHGALVAGALGLLMLEGLLQLVGPMLTQYVIDVAIPAHDESLNELFTSGVVAGLGDLFTLVAIGALMLATDWRLALWSFAVIPLIYLTSHVFQRSVRTSYRDIRAKLARINAYLQERLTAMRLVQLFGMQVPERQSFDRLNREHLDAHLKSITYYALYFPAIEILSSVALALLIVAGARRVEVGTLTGGTVAAFLQLLRRFYQPLQDLSDKFNILQQAMAASERVFQLLDEPVEAAATGDRRSAIATADRQTPMAH